MTSSQSLRLRLAAEDLGAVLERLAMLHDCLAKILVEKEQRIVESDIDAIDEIREREEVALLAIVDEEKERLLITEEIGDLLEVEEPNDLKIDDLLPELDAGSRERLTIQRNTLRDLAGRMRQQNQRNRSLIEHSLGHVRLFMSQLQAAALSNGNYEASGTAADAEGPSLLMDRRG